VIDQIGAALRRRRILSAALIASLLAAIYWGLVASDRYVSEAHVIIQRTDLTNGNSVDLAGAIGTVTSRNAGRM